MAVGVSILGCTGSIGRSALAVLARHPDEFRVVALAANSRVEQLSDIARQHPEALVVIGDEGLRGHASLPERVQAGRNAMLEAATHADADIVVNAIVGAAGLEASLATLRAGKRLALANKESLVAGGPLVLEAAREGGGDLVPIDSEHSAILQCLAGREQPFRRLIITASGGPFREYSADRLQVVTREEALNHPTWDMGAKVTIDSATLANKALEVIEAHFLFDADYDDIDVVVHPQSVVHSMVEFEDGSVIAQLGFPTMELPILYALTHPRRIPDTGTRVFDPVAAGPLTFEPVDTIRFPTFGLGIAAARSGGTAPAVFNAANEIAVAGFLSGKLSFERIPDVVDAALTAVASVAVDSMETVLEADRRARAAAVRTAELQ